MANMGDASMDLTTAFPEDLVTRSDVPVKDCVVCGNAEKKSNMMAAPCGDTYCGGCVNTLFDRAAEKEYDFPPRCCGQIITLEDAGWILSLETYQKFLEKYEEFSTIDRTYCSDPECKTFIPSNALENDKAKCPTCQKLTCIMCKAEAHEGDCSEDPAYQSLLMAAAEAGFQRCRKCKRMIELTEGCHHITCICGANFCYLCGNDWGYCICHSEHREYWMNWALQYVEQFHDDGRIELRQEYVNLAEEGAIAEAADREVELEAP